MSKECTDAEKYRVESQFAGEYSIEEMLRRIMHHKLMQYQEQQIQERYSLSSSESSSVNE